MEQQRWRPSVAVLGGTGWLWSLVLPDFRDTMLNPGIYPSNHRLLLVAAMVALAAVDLWAVWYMTSAPRDPD